MESKIRQLVMRLEYVDALKLAHPFIKGFDNVYYCLSEEEAQAVTRGEIPDDVAKRTKEDVEGKEGVKTMHATSFFIGLSIKPKEGDYLNSDMSGRMCSFRYVSWGYRTSTVEHHVPNE